jgi:hypothetical protein
LLASSPFVDRNRRASILDRVRRKNKKGPLAGSKRSRLSVAHRLKMGFLNVLKCRCQKKGHPCLTCRHKSQSQDSLHAVRVSPVSRIPTRVHKYPPHSDAIYCALTQSLPPFPVEQCQLKSSTRDRVEPRQPKSSSRREVRQPKLRTEDKLQHQVEHLRPRANTQHQVELRQLKFRPRNNPEHQVELRQLKLRPEHNPRRQVEIRQFKVRREQNPQLSHAGTQLQSRERLLVENPQDERQKQPMQHRAIHQVPEEDLHHQPKVDKHARDRQSRDRTQRQDPMTHPFHQEGLQRHWEIDQHAGDRQLRSRVRKQGQQMQELQTSPHLSKGRQRLEMDKYAKDRQLHDRTQKQKLGRQFQDLTQVTETPVPLPPKGRQRQVETEQHHAQDLQPQRRLHPAEERQHAQLTQDTEEELQYLSRTPRLRWQRSSDLNDSQWMRTGSKVEQMQSLDEPHVPTQIGMTGTTRTKPMETLAATHRQKQAQPESTRRLGSKHPLRDLGASSAKEKSLRLAEVNREPTQRKQIQEYVQGNSNQQPRLRQEFLRKTQDTTR